MDRLQITLAAFSDEASPSLEGQILALKRNGLTYMEIRNVDKKNCADLTVAEAKELRRRLDGEGLRVQSIGSPLGKINITADFAPEMERFLRVTELAEILGADKIRLFSFFRDNTLEEAKGQALALERLNAFAARRGGLLLCHENEKGIYGDGWEFCKTVCTEIPSIRAVFDPANFVQCGVDTLRAWEELKDFTAYLHLKDSTAEGVVVPCGEGIGNVPFILKDYMRRGGNFATLEPHLYEFIGKAALEKESDKTCGYAYENADQAFDAAVEAVRNILNTEEIRL